MSLITIPGPSLLYVHWGCRRCGHRGGVARTTVPTVDAVTSNTEIMHALIVALRKKLVRVHQRGQGCVAAYDDFTFESYVPVGKTLVERV